MQTSVRFENAVKRLYKAFHSNTLNPENCKQCAVGNIMDNNDAWQHLTEKHASLNLSYVGLVHQNLGRKFNGYTPLELLKIEAAFLRGCGYKMTSKLRLQRPKDLKDDTVLFNGLCEVVSELCRCDKIDDIMDCSILFEFDKKPSQLAHA